MMKKQNIIFLTIFFILSSLIFFQELHSKIRFNFVGYKVCEGCHSSDSLGNQIKIWKLAPHSRAYKTLRTQKAREIAAKYNIEKPYDDLKCLKCHTTGRGKVELTKKEGVGCESCHGPASGYVDFNIHASSFSRAKRYEKSLKYGMYPILGIDHIKNRERLCRSCHTIDPETRLCVPEDPKLRQEDKLSLEVISEFIFKHPVK